MTILEKIRLTHTGKPISGIICLPLSKSLNNRALAIRAIAERQGSRVSISGISDAKDTELMYQAAQSLDSAVDVGDAGTAMRFCTALFAMTGQVKQIYGSARMHQRPIGILVDALRTLGAEVDYLAEEGYPPLLIKGFAQKNHQISVSGHVSSQYISAILMAAPSLPNGLSLRITGQILSRPYIQMTLAMMATCGIEHSWEMDTIRIKPQIYRSANLSIEPDWSAASYWYAIMALAPASSEIKLVGLQSDSLQGDRVISEIMGKLGVMSTFEGDGVVLRKQACSLKHLEYDFAECPDLAQTLAVVCAGLGISARLGGLDNLRIKETDRISALQHELSKFGIRTHASDDSIELGVSTQVVKDEGIDTYGDHRMAMSFAPLALLHPVEIHDPWVVTKSYPRFWADLVSVGFEIS